jgi:arginyl-tRNA synthetase
LDNKYIDQILKQGIFVNILVSPDYVKDILSYVPQGKILDKFLNIKAVVDYSSPNIAKQMSMGHFRATIL